MPLILLKTSERIKAFTYTMNMRLYREVLQEPVENFHQYHKANLQSREKN